MMIFLFSPRKQGLTLHANCLRRKHFACNVKSCFLGKLEKYFKMSSAENFTQSVKIFIQSIRTPELLTVLILKFEQNAYISPLATKNILQIENWSLGFIETLHKQQWGLQYCLRSL